MNENNDLLMKEEGTHKIHPKKTLSGTKINYLFQYVTVTTQKQRDNFDLQIARFFFACNIPFSSVKHKEFKNLIQILRSGYLLPNRHRLSNALLDKVHNNIIYECKKCLMIKQFRCQDGLI